MLPERKSGQTLCLTAESMLIYKMGVLILVTLVVQIQHAKRQGGFIPPAVYATYTRPLFFWMTCTAFAGKFFLSCP